MTKNDSPVNSASGFAPLRNVQSCTRVMEHLITRAPNLPGMGVFYGASGLGKSFAAAACTNKFNAVYVECRSYFTTKSLLLSICKEMRLRAGATVYDMVSQISEQLSLSGRPLILDEMDHIVDKRLVEIVRDLYEASSAPILMIGEELFPAKLKRWERFHNRVLDWQPAAPSDLADAKKLARVYSSDVEIADDLLERIVQASRGVARRICVNIELVRQEAKSSGTPKGGFDAARWGTRDFYTGEAPARRLT